MNVTKWNPQPAKVGETDFWEHLGDADTVRLELTQDQPENRTGTDRRLLDVREVAPGVIKLQCPGGQLVVQVGCSEVFIGTQITLLDEARVSPEGRLSIEEVPDGS